MNGPVRLSTNQHIVHLLGAGASVHAGYPLVSNFISALSRKKPTGGLQLGQLFDLVRICIKRFQGLNIEELIMLASSPQDPKYKKVIEMVETGNNIDQIGQQYIVIPLKYAVIYLLDCIAQKTPRTPEIERFLKNAGSTIITFNWDILPDKVLMEDYGVDWLNIKSGKENGRKYLKLHGSADCLYCLNCKEPFRVDVATLVAKWTESNYSCPYCGGIESHGIETRSYASEPLLIGFSNDKRTELARIPLLQSQWNRARQELMGCDELVVVGFSFNTIDQHVLFFLDSVLRMRKKDITVKVINPDKGSKFRRDVVAAFGGDTDSSAKGNAITLERYGQRVAISFRTIDFVEYVRDL